ncbi:uncharacterized protein LOC134726238 [Mytilus trossulus]|uniref:uncharacterized protein LOC134726238 n=1 Tax=Mytilus trossulus TaxID=6551 RepID=UPI003005D0B8
MSSGEESESDLDDIGMIQMSLPMETSYKQIDQNFINEAIEKRRLSVYAEHDLVIKIENTKLHVNKDQLIAESPVFEKMLAKQSKEKDQQEIVLDGKNPNDFVDFLRCTLPGTDDQVTDKTVHLVTPLADEYQTTKTLQKADKFLTNKSRQLGDRISSQQVILNILQAESYNLTTYLDESIAIASRKLLSRLVDNPKFKEISSETRMKIAFKRWSDVDRVFESSGNLHGITESADFYQPYQMPVFAPSMLGSQPRPSGLYQARPPTGSSGFTLGGQSGNVPTPDLHFTLTQFIQHDVTKNMENSKQTDVLIMDFSKAFDKASYNLLTHKLNYYGIQGKTNAWIQGFLSCRTQAVIPEDQLNLVPDDHPLAWTEAFSSCNDPIYWHQIFNDCQPESCNASSVADITINAPSLGKQQYWIYGYVLRSPVLANIGCYSLNTSVKNAFQRGFFILEHNSAFECSMACPDNSLEYILLRGRECLCIPMNKFNNQLNKLMEESTGTCNQSCAGNTGDLCGGASVVDEKLLYSAYLVITRKKFSTNKVGDTCAVLHSNDLRQHRFSYTTCNSNHVYICERYNKSDHSYKDKCPNGTASWYIANKKCKEQDSRLRSYTSTSFSSSCSRREETFWIENHVAERIVWANDSLPKDALCLKLVITESGSHFETESCSISLHSLCYKRQHTSSEKNDEYYTTTVMSKMNSSTGPRYTFSDVENNQTNKGIAAAVDNSTENYVRYLTAVCIILVLSVIIAGTAFCIKRRCRQKIYTSFVPPHPQIYSDINTNPYDEITDFNMPPNIDEDGYEMPRSAKKQRLDDRTPMKH